MTNKAIDSQVLNYMHSLENSQQVSVLNYLKNLVKRGDNNNKNLLKLAGTINKKDIKLMEKAIEEGCENIDSNEW